MSSRGNRRRKNRPRIRSAISKERTIAIVYGEHDQSFAASIRNELDKFSIRTNLSEWKKIYPGSFRMRISWKGSFEKKLQPNDRALLCVSEQTLRSPWLDNLVDYFARAEERIENQNITNVDLLIPLDLDGSMTTGTASYPPALDGRIFHDFVNCKPDNVEFAEKVESLANRLRHSVLPHSLDGVGVL